MERLISMRQRLGARVLLAVAALSAPSIAGSQAALVDGLGGAHGYGSDELPLAGDTSSDEIALPSGLFPVGLDFFCATPADYYTGLWVNDNGSLSFDGAMSAYTPLPLPIADQPLIAPYWADVDTRDTTEIHPGLGRVPKNRVSWAFRTDPVSGQGQFIATWLEVAYYDGHNDLVNSFQVILTDRSDVVAGDFDIELRYNRVEWTTGDASGGFGGFGGTAALMGWDSGTEVGTGCVVDPVPASCEWYMHPDSTGGAIANLDVNSNVSDPGVFRYPIRSGLDPVCGNDLVEAGEDCEEGGVATEDCDPDCTIPECGDGVLNEVVEECDAGLFAPGLGACPDHYEGTPGCVACTVDTTVGCTDIDECADGADDCDANATCTNEDGGFSCACNPGWSGDGVTCTEDQDTATDDTATDDTATDDTATDDTGSEPDGGDCGCDTRSSGPAGLVAWSLLLLANIIRRREGRAM